MEGLDDELLAATADDFHSTRTFRKQWLVCLFGMDVLGFGEGGIGVTVF